MQGEKSIFQLVVAGIFGILLLIGFAMFATYKSPVSRDKITIGKVVIWGTLDERIVNKLIKQIADSDKDYGSIEYVEKSKKTFQQDILEALATQNSPDLILLSNEEFYKNQNKIYTIPYKNYPQRKFLETFADAFDVYINQEGIRGIPFTIDPMVLYYNKTLFSTSRVVLPPKKWEELEKPNGITTKITKLNENNNILKSAIGLGEANNIKHSKEILYTLFFEKGNPIIEWKDSAFHLSEKFFDKGSVIKFYTQFADQTNKITYTWNKTKDSDEAEFIAGNLGMYLGFVSEMRKIRLKNPNLNFYIAEMPDFSDSKEKKVYAKTWVLVIPKLANNKIGAFYAALKFASKEIQKTLAEQIYLPPVRKDLLSGVPESAFLDIFYKEAIYGQTIIEPTAYQMDQIFGDYINNVNTNLRNPSEATDVLEKEISNILK